MWLAILNDEVTPTSPITQYIPKLFVISMQANEQRAYKNNTHKTIWK